MSSLKRQFSEHTPYLCITASPNGISNEPKQTHPSHKDKTTAAAPRSARTSAPDGPLTLPAPVTKVDVELGPETVPVPEPLFPPAVVPAVELEKPPPLLLFCAGPGFVTLNELPATTLLASPAFVRTVMASKPSRVLAAVSRALVDCAASPLVSTRICV